ncbi:hypothetical protein PV416_08400 [Streptomyces ipomoeae]|jgi:hypothetical protein|uniref:DUF4034 domain-containing protein n=1 Tax=Streptomyces ipomoeae 91-03 TaxID=698759 RepID=L1KXM8_9ACTN|nr:hypothetical protein [Streptomyces ipomoeae]EKX65357.1 hypothetical protein STRIP9103_02245 [Streptomyces ipomoeae 91-03]MDX2693088.1 hypothetical protein [Streptomyces ipomoeae]MDX2821111.1 hypothetical protein [Streptomyces ipomoeae]MDX2838436.1 hypothetical protein [Streptomyces ipomoeae]MDX2875057.1 hypothetical protein [Streptomyces ipomoeae]
MNPLRALIRTARMARHTSGLADGLPADDEVLLDAPDERLGPALVAAGRGEYAPAAKLLGTTREAAEWENRDRYALRLASFAHARDEWLRTWQSAAPHDPDVLLIKAQSAVARGWHSPARVELLREVGPLIAAAAEGEPRDPVPWRIALDHARGTGLGHTGFEQLWAEAVRRSPHHYGCHVSALKYLSAAWYGSHRECFDFAERAAEDALPGSLVQALPVRAAFAHLTEGGGPEVPRARLDEAADRAIALSAEYEPGDPWPAEVRNLLTYVLVRLERWPDALEQLRMIGPYATSFPWDRVSDDPLGQFLQLRDGVRLEVASSIPLREGAGRSAAKRAGKRAERSRTRRAERSQTSTSERARPDDH